MAYKRYAARAGAALALTMAAASLATAAAPAGGVSVSTVPERQTLGRSDEVAVVVTITNSSKVTEYLLRWQTPFEPLTSPLFEVTRDGIPVRYLGRQVKRAPPGAADYIALAPGASRSVRVELSSLYQMGGTGSYSIRYRGGALQLFSAPGIRHAVVERAQAPAASVWIEGRLPRGQLETSPATEGGAGLSYSQCSNAQQATIAGAAQAAQAMATDAHAYAGQKNLGPRYTTWFGAFDSERAMTVLRHFVAIQDAFATKPVTVDCSCREDYYAYVYPNQPNKINVCNAFWAAPLTGTDSKGGTLVHEMSHFTVVAGTDDWAYGQSAAAALGNSDPARAIDNADSHEYFSENTPQQDMR